MKLGTPEEDIVSIASVNSLSIPTKILCCIGFGVDAHHGVNHYLFLENVAAIIKNNGYLGTFSLQQEMPECKTYADAIKYVFTNMNFESIVCGSVLGAIEGDFGNDHKYTSTRTAGTELFINPLMSLCWCFDLPCVASRILYLEEIKNTDNYYDIIEVIDKFRSSIKNNLRTAKYLPV